MKQFIQLISINFKEFFREPGIIFWAVLFPILMAWGLGIAFSKKDVLVQKIAVVANGQDLTTNHPGWNKLIDSATKQDPEKLKITTGNARLGYVNYEFVPQNWEGALHMIKKGETDVVVKISNDSLNFYFDPTNPEAQLTYLQLKTAMNNPAKAENKTNFVPLEKKGTRYIDFLMPGLLCMSVMMSCMWGISYGMIDKRSKKLLRRMIATPMSKSAFMAAQFIARLALSFLEALVLIIFCYFYFDVVISGSILAFLLVFIAGNIAFTGIAIFTSSRTADTRIGNGLVNLVVMPMMILSGVFFSYHNFPGWAVNVIEKLPLTLMADYTRSVFIEGAGLPEIFMPSLALALTGLVFSAVGLKIYRWY